MTSWLRPTPTGRPYQQLGRTDIHRWWRVVLSLVVMVIGFLVASVVFLIALELTGYAATGSWLAFADRDEIFKNPLANLMAMLGTIGVLLPVVMVAVVLVERRHIGSLSSVAGRLRWRWLLWCFLPAAVYMGAVQGASFLAAALGAGGSSADSGHWVGWSQFWPALLVITLLVPFQAAAEEYVFRGWIVQAIGSFTFEGREGRLGRACSKVFGTPWPAVLLSAIPFVAGHEYTGWGPVDIAVFAIATGWVVIFTGGLEAGIALHIVNNATSMGIDASSGDLSITEGSVPWTDVVTDALPLLLWAGLVVWMFRRHTGSRRPMKRLS
jgi:membrane protease YdiL (CAAX protease family)